MNVDSFQSTWSIEFIKVYLSCKAAHLKAKYVQITKNNANVCGLSSPMATSRRAKYPC